MACFDGFSILFLTEYETLQVGPNDEGKKLGPNDEGKKLAVD